MVPAYEFKVSKSALVNNLESSCPTLATSIADVYLSDGNILDDYTRNKIFNLKNDVLTMSNYSSISTPILNGMRLLIKSRTRNSISNPAYFLFVQAQSISCTLADIFSLTEPITVFNRVPNAQNYNTSHRLSFVARRPDCQL